MALPILIALPTGEATNIVKKHKAGITVLPGNPEELSKKFLELAKDKDLVRRLSNHSLNAARNYDRKKLALEMLNHIEEAVT